VALASWSGQAEEIQVAVAVWNAVEEQMQVRSVTEVQEPALKELSMQVRMQEETLVVLWARAGTRAAATTATASLNMMDRV